MPRVWIDIENSAGVRQGAGPILTATHWRQVARLDAAGEIAATLPAAEARAALAVPKAVLRAYSRRNNALVALGAGIVDRHQVTGAVGIAPALTLAGPDLLAELARRSVGFLDCSDGSGGPVTDALDRIMAFAPAGWSLDTITGHATTASPVYVKFAGESVLAALARVAELTGEHFRVGTARQVIWLQTDQVASGVRAVASGRGPALEGNTAVAVITLLEVADDSHELFTRIYPYGAGNASARLTLADTTRSAPAGYTLDLVNNFLRDDTAESTYGRIDRHWTEKTVTPGAATTTDAASAADQLFDAALVALKRGAALPVTYRLGLTGCRQALYPGTTIRVVAQHWVDGGRVIDVDADLLILEAVLELDGAGIATVGLTVSTVDRAPQSDIGILVKAVQQAQVMEAHTQPAAEAAAIAGAQTAHTVLAGPASGSPAPAAFRLLDYGELTGTPAPPDPGMIAYAVKTASFTADPSEATVYFVDCSPASVDCNLDAVAGSAGQHFTFITTANGGSNTMNIVTASGGSENVLRTSSGDVGVINCDMVGDAIEIVSDGNYWYVLVSRKRGNPWTG